MTIKFMGLHIELLFLLFNLGDMGIGLYQINLSPRVPLGRRGCKVESSLGRGSYEFWNDTHFGSAIKTVKTDHAKRNEINDFIYQHYNDYVAIFRKATQNNLTAIDRRSISYLKLKEWNIINEPDKLALPINFLGNLFECLVCNCLYQLEIESEREVKISYPYKDRKYDPDGQKYDIIGTLDISDFIWIECKKPLYLSEEHPLSNVISSQNIDKFIRRSSFLRPTIAIFLVDTKDDYSQQLKSIFTTEILESGLYVEKSNPDNHIISRLNGFMYFNRVNFKSNEDYMKSLLESISQVLHDSRHSYPVNLLPSRICK